MVLQWQPCWSTVAPSWWWEQAVPQAGDPYLCTPVLVSLQPFTTPAPVLDSFTWPLHCYLLPVGMMSEVLFRPAGEMPTLGMAVCALLLKTISFDLPTLIARSSLSAHRQLAHTGSNTPTHMHGVACQECVVAGFGPGPHNTSNLTPHFSGKQNSLHKDCPSQAQPWLGR